MQAAHRVWVCSPKLGIHKSNLVCAELLELLLAEENVMDVVGALEHDPELAARQNHRAFLREHVIFKEVCALEASTIRLCAWSTESMTISC